MCGLLIVALELLGLVVAVGLAFPGAMKEAVSLRDDVLVQGVVSGRLSVTSLSAGGVGLGKSRSIFDLGDAVLGHHWDFSVSEAREPVRRLFILSVQDNIPRGSAVFGRGGGAVGGRPCIINGGRGGSSGDGGRKTIPGGAWG